MMVIACALLLSSVGHGQLRITGQASAAYLKSEAGYSQYVVDNGRGTFAWQLDLFADAVIAEHFLFMSNYRIAQDQNLQVELFSLRMTDIASTGINLEAGEIELPFGNLGERRFPKGNPFFNLPLTHEHRSSLRSSTYSLWPVDARFTRNDDGIRLIDEGLYDLGVKVFGSFGVIDYAAALVNGMVGATSTYSIDYQGNGMNATGGFGKIFRLAVTPFTGLTVAGSYAYGPFLRHDAYAYYGKVDPSEQLQKIVEGDVDFSIDHFSLYGECFSNIWKVNSLVGADLKAAGYSVEAKYTPYPRVSLAVRAGGLFFNDVTVTITPDGYTYESYQGPWDHDVTRYEAALGYRLDRDALVKIVYQWNNTLHVQNAPLDNVLAVQGVLSF